MSTAELTDQVVEFLTTGTRTGKIAWVSKDGRALVTPSWFIVEDGALVVNTGVDTSKGRALQRDSRATIVVDDEKPPFSFVQVQGTVSFDDDPDDLLRTATAIAERYMGPDLAEQFGKRNAVPGEALVRLTPTKVIAAFDIAD